MKKSTAIILTAVSTALTLKIGEIIYSKITEKKKPPFETVTDYATYWVNNNTNTQVMEFMDDPSEMIERIQESKEHADPNTGACAIMIKSQAEYNTFMSIISGLSEEDYEMKVYLESIQNNTNTH